MERQQNVSRGPVIRACVRLAMLAGLVLSVCPGLETGQAAPGTASVSTLPTSEKSVSRTVARMFYQHALDLIHSGSATERRTDEAVTYLMAARELDIHLTDASLLLFDIAAQTNQAALEPLVRRWVFESPVSTVNTPSMHKAVRYLIGQQTQRGGLERLAVQLQQFLGGNSSVLASELFTHLGLAARQRPDQRGADRYFARAYEEDKYNRVAFAQLAELAPDKVDASMTLEHLRLSIRENPLDLDSALAFAQYAERLQFYDIAAGCYAYCADVFAYLYEGESLPGHIYIPWAISTYNSQTNLDTVGEIAERVRQAGVFDLFLEAIAGRALAKSGKDQDSQRLLQQAEERARKTLSGPLLSTDPNAGGVAPKALAWYYCFGREDPAQALDWANKAYALDPNGPATLAILAYALVLNEQGQWAQPLIDKGPANQISEMARARIQLSLGEAEQGVATLRAAVERDAGSLAADHARRLLEDLGHPYQPPALAQTVLGSLVNSLGDQIVPTFEPPHKTIGTKLGTVNTAITYGSDLRGILTLVNQSKEPLVISPQGLLRGRVRVDAQVKGALTRDFPRVLEMDLFGIQEVASHRSVTVQFPLLAGDLRQVLLAHPQASLNIRFTIYLDPAERPDGTPWNRLADIEPIEIQVGRPALSITERSLRSQYNAIALTDAQTKIQTARLFTGLLKEQQIKADSGLPYTFRYADWLPGWLTSALIDPSGLLRQGHDQDWELRVHTLNSLEGLRLEGGLLQALGDALQDPHWPVRFRVLALIAANPTPGFEHVLDWTAKHDVHPLVRSLATLLVGRAAKAR